MTWQSQQGIAGRIAVLESRNPDIMIWAPGISITGKWEALLADGQLITDGRGARFYDRVAARLGMAGGTVPGPSAVTICPLCRRDLSQVHNCQTCGMKSSAAGSPGQAPQ